MNKLLLLGSQSLKAGSNYGSKAVMLGKMIRAGMKVPAGFVLPGKYFKKHLRVSGSFGLLKSGDLAAVKEAILKTQVKSSLIKEIEDIRQKLKLERVSVRSSSTLEDSNKGAAAGQFETVLNVPAEKISDAVKQVWASAFSERAVEYIKHSKIPLSKIGMAVIIQEMIESDVSGVAFSLDPVTLDDKFMVVESCYGLGEALVSGKITPANYTISKKSLSVTSERPLRQDVMCVGKKDGLTEYINVPYEFYAGKLLIDSEIIRLASQVVTLEKAFGMYVDTEWSISKGELYFLQCRPVTAITPPKNTADVWSNVNIAEVLPGQNFPLVVSTCKSVIELPLKQSFGMAFEIELVRDIKGRLYFNLSAIEDHFRERLGMKNFSAELLFGGQEKAPVEESKPVFNLKVAGLVMRLFFGSLLLQGWLKRFLKTSPEIRKRQLLSVNQAATLPELLAVKKELDCSLVNSLRKAFASLVIPVGMFGFFDKAAKKAGLTFEEKQNLLSGGNSEVELLGAFKVLWEISRVLRKNTSLLKSFNETQNAAGAEEVIKSEPVLSVVYKSFFELYGHRGIKEIDFSVPRWQEERSFIINTLKLYVKVEDRNSPIEKEKHAEGKRSAVLAGLNAKLPAWKIRLLDFLAKRGRAGQNTRELVKGSLMGFFVPYRSLVLKMAFLLKSKGLMIEELDIFFLNREEFDNLDNNLAPLAHINSRKVEYIKNKDLYLPDVITDIGLLVGKGKFELFPGSKELKGLAVSNGKYTGVARVILNPSEIGRLGPGEILVTDHTDPGWTPLFVVAGALITNTGGMLSHSSITAREYGLPAVVSVADATMIIKDGVLLAVDGNTGRIQILT